MSTYAIGDIHGCLSALKAIFNHARINEDDTVVFMGDYVDRGPDSKGVLNWLIENKYLYNGKELNDDWDINLYEYGARWYDPAIGRWTSVDPLADIAPSWTPYRYAFDNPLIFIDPDGMFEDKDAAKQYAKDNGIKTGFLRRNKIKEQKDGTYAIENEKEKTSISDYGGDLGIMTATMVSPYDVMSTEIEQGGIFSNDALILHFRDGSQSEAIEPVTGTVPTPGKGGFKGLKLLKKFKFLKGSKAPTLPKLDSTGKVHGKLPKAKDLGKYSKEELQILRQELKASVQQRIKVTSRLGRDKAHGQRQGNEQNLIQAIDKYLSGS